MGQSRYLNISQTRYSSRFYKFCAFLCVYKKRQWGTNDRCSKNWVLVKRDSFNTPTKFRRNRYNSFKIKCLQPPGRIIRLFHYKTYERKSLRTDEKILYKTCPCSKLPKRSFMCFPNNSIIMCIPADNQVHFTQRLDSSKDEAFR